MTVAEALAAATRRLRAVGVPEPERDARRLMAHALGVAPDRITLLLRDEMAETALAAFEAAVARRADRVPVSQIVGRRAFYGRYFEVTADVLDPRPETETVVAAALREPFGALLDLGTGSGCILLTCLAERPDATGLGVDVSARALAVAARNADRLGVAGRTVLVRSDWFEAVAGRFDLVASNPPYVAEGEIPALAPELSHEPRLALVAGEDGLDAYRRIAAGALAHLRPGGRLLLEVGAGQAAEVEAILARAGLESAGRHRDLGGRDRVVEARAPARR